MSASTQTQQTADGRLGSRTRPTWKCSICGQSHGEHDQSGPGLHRFHGSCVNGALNFVHLLNDVNSVKLAEPDWFSRPALWPNAPKRARDFDAERIRGKFPGWEPDAALLLRAMLSGVARFEPFIGRGFDRRGDGRGEVCVGGIRHSVDPGPDGLPVLTSNCRLALASALATSSSSPASSSEKGGA